MKFEDLLIFGPLWGHPWFFSGLKCFNFHSEAQKLIKKWKSVDKFDKLNKLRVLTVEQVWKVVKSKHCQIISILTVIQKIN